jgi:AAHS family 4-hydroxybenzoate transporter-like MFS transporter
MAMIDTRMTTPFDEALARRPVGAFQLATAAICLVVLMCDGVDMQLLGLVAPLVIKDFGVDKSSFGIAMSAALIGMGIGAWFGGWLGDRIGRRYSLALAALSFGFATIAASLSDGIWPMAAWRFLGGLGFGAAFSNALAMTSEWLPERWRPLAITSLSVGTPAGGAIAGALVPFLLAGHGWRGTFVLFGASTLVLVLIVLLLLRDSPAFLLATGRTAEADRLARRFLGSPAILAGAQRADIARHDEPVGVFDASNLRLNLGVALGFGSATLVAYAILNWSTSLLTARGMSLPSASYAVSVAGVAAIIGSVATGVLVRAFGSRQVLLVASGVLLLILVTLASVVERTAGAPDAQATAIIVVLIGLAAATFSCAIATHYVIITLGYPQSCRSSGIGFGVFVGRIGAILASGFGGTLLDLGHGSSLIFFIVLAVGSLFIAVASFIIDRHVVARASRVARQT